MTAIFSSSHFYLDVSNLTFSYTGTGGGPILDRIEYRFQSGQIYVLVGPSGAGKSTFLRLLSGVFEPQSGLIRIQESNAKSAQILSGKRRMDLISTIPQDDALLPWRTVRENIMLPLELGAVSPLPDREKKVQKALERFHLGPYQHHFPDELSGGLKKLAALARVYIENRPILLLDEPFSAIDVFSRTSLYQTVRSLAKDQGKLVIAVTHDFYDCEHLADTVLLLAGSSLVRDVDIKTLIAMRSSPSLHQEEHRKECSWKLAALKGRIQ